MASLKSLVAMSMLATAILPAPLFGQSDPLPSIAKEMDRAEKLLGSGKPTDASAILEKAAQALPSGTVGNALWSRLQLLRGRAFLDRNMPYDSLEVLFNLNQKAHQSAEMPEGFVIMGDALIRLNKPTEACGMLMRALSVPLAPPLKYRANQGFYKAQCSALNGYDPFAKGDGATRPSVPAATMPSAKTAEKAVPASVPLETDTNEKRELQPKPVQNQGISFKEYRAKIFALDREADAIEAIYKSITGVKINKSTLCSQFLQLSRKSNDLKNQANNLKSHNARMATDVLMSKDVSDDLQYTASSHQLSNLALFFAEYVDIVDEHYDETCL